MQDLLDHADPDWRTCDVPDQLRASDKAGLGIDLLQHQWQINSIHYSKFAKPLDQLFVVEIQEQDLDHLSNDIRYDAYYEDQQLLCVRLG